MKNVFALVALLVACQRGSCEAPGRQTTPSASALGSAGAGREVSRLGEEQKAWLARANRHEKHGWVYLHIQGQPPERGFQHGYLLAKEIHESLTATKAIWKYHSGMDWPWLVEKAKTVLGLKVDAENLAEIDGMVEGLRIAGVATSRQELIAYNGILELVSYWWPKEREKVQRDFTGPSRQSWPAFIATGSATTDGRIVLGHNMMADIRRLAGT